jgi:hypothetical protein
VSAVAISEPLTSWPRPLRSRASSASRAPKAAPIAVPKSTQLTPARRGASGSPLMNTAPDIAWPMPSKPTLCASGPVLPKASVATRIARALIAATLA